MERIDDLERDGLRLIQNPDKFCFGIDAVLLSDFAKVRAGETIVDIGTGTGVIPILLTSKCPGAKKYIGIEIQNDMADMAKRSVELNGLSNKVEIIGDNVVDSAKYIANQTVEVVTCNPPYMNDDQGLKNDNESISIARHEISCSLDDIICQANRMLKSRGRLYMIHRPNRLVDLITTLRKYKLEPKKLRMVHPYVGKEATMVLVEAVKGSNAFLKVEPPLVVYKTPNEYTDEIYKIYRE